MPNHITNLIHFSGYQKDIDHVLDIIKGDNGDIDFNKLIPMPSNIYTGDLGREELHKYGRNNWYNWCCDYWGTKWNAYYICLYRYSNTLKFDTAWNCPVPVLHALADLCAQYDVDFNGKYADEDMGNNVGVFSATKGNLEVRYVEDDSNEAFDIYVELKGDTDCLGKDSNGNWIRYDCDNCPHPC